MTLIYISIILVLILISAFFSGSETGITTSSRGKIHKLGSDGDKRAKKVEKLLKNKESLMGTILLGNNVVNILASALATSIFLQFFGQAGILYATIVMTLAILIFSEITPKIYAIKNAEKTALFAATTLTFLVKIFYPITKIIYKITNLFLNSKNSNNTQFMISDLDEIRGAIELKHKEGSIVKYDKDMMSGILDLGEIEIGDIIIHRKNIESINIDQKLENILKDAFRINHTRIPLWKNDKDNIVSILNVRKLAKVFHHNKGDINKINLEEITSAPWFVPETNNLKKQLFDFRNKRKRLAIVIDEYGDLMGIITLEDILEEIVGNMADKKSKKTIEITKSKNGSYKIFGEVPIRDINRRLNWNLPETDDNSSTLAGLIISKMEKIPDEKEKFQLNDFHFEIVKKKQNRIISIKVTKKAINLS